MTLQSGILGSTVERLLGPGAGIGGWPLHAVLPLLIGLVCALLVHGVGPGGSPSPLPYLVRDFLISSVFAIPCWVGMAAVRMARREEEA